jgi:hypothetical protein
MIPRLEAVATGGPGRTELQDPAAHPTKSAAMVAGYIREADKWSKSGLKGAEVAYPARIECPLNSATSSSTSALRRPRMQASPRTRDLMMRDTLRSVRRSSLDVKLPYSRSEGFRTAEISLPFKLFGAIQPGLRQAYAAAVVGRSTALSARPPGERSF